MYQSRTESLIEAGVNTVIGFGINFIANIYVLPVIFGIHITVHQNFLLGAIFTGISIVRSYTLRRFFNSYLRRCIRKILLVYTTKKL